MRGDSVSLPVLMPLVPWTAYLAPEKPGGLEWEWCLLFGGGFLRSQTAIHLSTLVSILSSHGFRSGFPATGHQSFNWYHR